jgi:TPP-dependent pyruvate/acetoin dehydrogenase alpha subunit
VEAARREDPIARFRSWMVASGHADEAFVKECDRHAESFAAEVREGVAATAAPPPEWMFEWVYAAPSDAFERQRREALDG